MREEHHDTQVGAELLLLSQHNDAVAPVAAQMFNVHSGRQCMGFMCMIMQQSMTVQITCTGWLAVLLDCELQASTQQPGHIECIAHTAAANEYL